MVDNHSHSHRQWCWVMTHDIRQPRSHSYWVCILCLVITVAYTYSCGTVADTNSSGHYTASPVQLHKNMFVMSPVILRVHECNGYLLAPFRSGLPMPKRIYLGWLVHGWCMNERHSVSNVFILKFYIRLAGVVGRIGDRYHGNDRTMTLMTILIYS